MPGVLPAAHRFFRAHAAHSWVPDHVAARGLGLSATRRWQIGYAPPGRDALTAYLRRLGYPEAEIVAAGLARHGRDGRPYDLFRDRAMFAIRDPYGRIAGFLGRRRDGPAPTPGPKYLNSPASPGFRKRELLFGLHEARAALRRGARPVLVEGPFDVLAMDAAGLAAVAPCGMFLTAAHLAALAAVSDLDATGLLLALDGDAGGRRGVLRAARLLAGIGGPVEVADPGTGDPADVLRTGGPAAVRDLLRSTTPLADLVVDTCLDTRTGDSPEDRLAAVRTATTEIARMRPHQAARQVARVAHRLDVPHPVVTSALVAALTS